MNNLQLSVLLSAMDKMSAPIKSAVKNVDALSHALNRNKNLRGQLIKQDKQQASSLDQYRSKLNPLINRLNTLKAEQEKAQQTAMRLSKRLKELKNPSDAYRLRVENAQQSVKKLKVEEVDLSNKLQRARAELAKSGITAHSLSQRQTELRGKLKSANSEISKQSAELKKLNAQQAKYNAYRGKVDKLKDISGRAQILGTQTMAVGVGGAIVTANFLKPAADFEQDFSKVQALTNLSQANPEQAKQLEQLRNQAIHLGATTSFTSGEVAQGQGYLAMAGFNAQQIEQSMPAVLSMTKASGIDMGLASDIASDISSGFKISANEMNRVADVLTATFTGSNTTLEGLGDTMKYLGPIATATGQNFETMSAMVGLLGNVGIKGTQAGTSLRAAMLRLAGPPKQAAVAMKKLGVSAKDSRGNMRSLTDILVDVARKTEKMGSAQKMAYYKAIFGAEAATAMVELVGQAGINGIQEMTDKLKNAEDRAKQIADVMGDNILGDLKTLESARDALSITVFDSVKGSLRGMVQSITDLLRKIDTWAKAHPKLTSALVKFGIAIVGSLTVLGALSLALSFLIYPIARIGLGLKHLNDIFPNVSGKVKIFTKTLMSWKATGQATLNVSRALGSSLLKLLNPLTYLRGAFNAITLVVTALRTAFTFLAFTPLGLFITAIATGALLIYRNWEKVRAFFGGFWEGLKSGLAPVIEKFKPLGDLFGVVVGWIEKAVTWVLNLINPVQSTSAELDNAASAGKKFGEWLAAGIDLVTKPIQWVMDSITWIKNNLPSIEKSAQKVMTNSHAGTSFNNGLGFDPIGNSTAKAAESVPNVNKWSGGYAGNGGKYEPMGIFHGGEYIMTKEATSRLGVPLLNALNYGKNTMLAAGLGVSVAAAQPVNLDVVKDIQHQIMVIPPIQVDDRAPLRQTQTQQVQITQPMNITIQVNAAQGMDERALAREVARQIAQIKNQEQARARSDFRGRG